MHVIWRDAVEAGVWLRAQGNDEGQLRDSNRISKATGAPPSISPTSRTLSIFPSSVVPSPSVAHTHSLPATL